ncbi:MAG TPA: hypothetical protein VM686_36795 [Polyangiaceae bacterium]|nr:hypothetical protein [Polyangiaceae bacterium]
MSEANPPRSAADRPATLGAAQRELSAAEAELRLALRRVKAAPRADKITISDSLQAAFDNLSKVRSALTAIERAILTPSED